MRYYIILITMSSTDVLSMYIKKLDHPMKEIRERSLQLLTAKLKLGLQIDNELSLTRKLLESLLSWFDDEKPILQNEALCLLLKTIKTKSGTYIVRELNIKKVLTSLIAIKNKIDPNAKRIFDDVIETLRFLNTMESDNDLIVPPLSLASSTSSENKTSFNNGHNNSNVCDDPLDQERLCNLYMGTDNPNRLSNRDGIKVLLFPWVDLSSSDLKTLLLLEDALKVVKSIRRCCRFIRDVFLRDFPPEIFLNRPTVVNILLKIASTQQNGHLGEALHVLLCITIALHQRLKKLFSIELVHGKNKVSKEINDSNDDVNTALENIVGEYTKSPYSEDSLAVLRQMPAPVFALDVSYSILSIMSRNIVLFDSHEYGGVSTQNICLNLFDSLLDLLLNCVDDTFWTVEHTSKTHKDIAHKTCMLMRMLGELIIKYKRFYMENTERDYYRTAWLRLISSAEKLVNWLKSSPLPPVSLIATLQSAQLDPAIELLYPELCKRINDSLLTSKVLTDQEHKTKYKALKKLFISIDYAVQFMKNKNGSKSTKEILTQIQNSIQILSMHQNESFLEDIANILLYKSKHLFTEEDDWTIVRSISLKIMAHNKNWVKVMFYQLLVEMVKSVLFGNEMYQSQHEQSLMLLCDVGVLTEICCHGLSSNIEEVNVNASMIMVYLLRGRLVLSESCWWRLLASLLPILPLLHVYASHDTELGKAICKSLEPDIVQCMGVSFTEMVGGLTRLLFVKCIAIQLEAAHALCRLLDDDQYLPPKESLRSDLLLNALRRMEPQDFNLDTSSSSSRSPQTAGLVQILEVLKQDLILDEDGKEYVACNARPTLEPSLRRSTLQQLSVLLRQQDAHDVFLQYDGINLIVSILRLSLKVDDYLAFPECAISCVSVLNSVSFASRHNLAKIVDLPLLLIRVILVFPSNDSSVLMSAQILALTAWSGFVLQEINSSRQKVPALPLCVTQRTSLPFPVNSYWSTSPNSEHCPLEWLFSDDEWRRAIRIRWWCAWAGGARSIRHAVATLPAIPAATLFPDDLALIRSVCVIYCSTKGLLALENATSHSQVMEAIAMLQSYISLVPWSCTTVKEYAGLPWYHVRRFLCAPPASTSDTALLIRLLQFVIGYMDNIPADEATMSWIKAYFIGNDVAVISLLSRERLYPQQTSHEGVEVTQLHIHIIKIICRCIKLLENQDDYDVGRMESLLKILISCLDKIDVKNFHKLGYLNELMRCIRYALYSRYCKLSEESLLESLKVLTRTLCDCGSGSGRKGQGCKLDAVLALIALLRHIHVEDIPVQRWSEAWSGQVLLAVTACVGSDSAELRAAALHVMATLVHYAQLLPYLLQSIPNEALCSYAMDIFLRHDEANVVRTSAASLLAANAARTSTHTDVFENEIIKHLQKNDFLECCLQIFVEFCCDKKKRNRLHPNMPLSVLERRSELEVRAQKSGDVHLSPSMEIIPPPPTADLLVAVADLLHNVSTFKNCPIEEWNEQGVYRVIFRCASWDCDTISVGNQVRSAVCRSLSAVAPHKCVRLTLANTKDCLIKLLQTLTASIEEDREEVSARTHTFLLLAALLAERSAGDSVWNELRERSALPLFSLLQHSIVHDDDELQDAAMYFLTQLVKSAMNKKHADKSADECFVDFFNNFKCDGQEPLSGRGEGDGRRDDDCQPEYVCEELCKLLIYRFQDLFDKRKCKASQDESWIRVSSCLSHLLTTSDRCRLYAVHRRLPSVMLAALQAVRDQLSLHGKPADVIRNANHEPVLLTLYWLLTTVNCSIFECPPAKETFADNAAASLNKLWPWCMMTEQLRSAIMHLLVTFTNDCPKAWACMCACVSGRNLINELCTLVGRSGGPILHALRILRQCAPHHHCRAILLKSEVLSCMGKTCGRGRSCGAQSAAWVQLCTALARHADGGAALLSLPALRPPHARLMPALVHAAHHHRAAFLHAPDLLELFSAALLAGNTSEVALAARAVWALAANNHRAKQVLRNAGVTTAVQSALQRHQRASCEETQQALQLLTYTNNVLQAT